MQAVRVNSRKTRQTGGTIIGFIAGVVVGLGAALAVAAYVTRVPVPFLTKGNGRSAEMDAAESRKNKDWDPNLLLYGKNPVRPLAPAASVAAPADSASATSAPASAPRPAEAKSEAQPGSDPLGDLAVARAAAKGSADPFDYFVQAGAFRTQSDADAQRAKLAMLGWEARISEREQNGRSVFRVRVGPFTKRDDAAQLKEKLDGAEVESTLVRAQR